MAATDDIKVLLRSIPEQVLNTGNLDRADDLIAPDYTEHVPLPPSTLSGLAGFKRFWRMMLRAFPDLHYTTDDLLAEGDKAVGRFTVRGKPSHSLGNTVRHLRLAEARERYPLESVQSAPENAKAQGAAGG